MQDWMTALGTHITQMRRRHPQDKLMVVFDIDGTILDMRYLVHHMLHWYDREHGTTWFAQLTVTDINSHETVISGLLADCHVPEDQRAAVHDWYYAHYWTEEAIAESHQAFAGVMNVIRWCQAQTNVFVGLNTGRFDAQRQDTLRSLNKLGAAHGVRFQNQFLQMRPNDWEESVAAGKVVGIQNLQRRGYRVIAFVDNEPENLAVIAQHDMARDILPMHANTLYLSDPALLPDRTVQGHAFDPHRLAYTSMVPFPAPASGPAVRIGPSVYYRKDR